jgi:hypothetical protein
MTGNSMKDFSSENKIDKPSQLKRIYIKPEIIHEMVLETRAGLVLLLHSRLPIALSSN